jgi:hypothetical protein
MSEVALAASPAADDDRAWISIETPLTATDLSSFVEDDIERLFRINPLLVFETFEAVGLCSYRVRAHNLSNGRDIDTEIHVDKGPQGIDVRYASGLKNMTTVRVETSGANARLVVTDIYSGQSEAERQARVAEVDLSLNAWGRALHEYLRRWARWRWLGPWRWYMKRVWQPMTPSARRIVFLTLAISVFEIATVAIVLVVWLATA